MPSDGAPRLALRKKREKTPLAPRRRKTKKKVFFFRKGPPRPWGGRTGLETGKLKSPAFIVSGGTKNGIFFSRAPPIPGCIPLPPRGPLVPKSPRAEFPPGQNRDLLFFLICCRSAPRSGCRPGAAPPALFPRKKTCGGRAPGMFPPYRAARLFLLINTERFTLSGAGSSPVFWTGVFFFFLRAGSFPEPDAAARSRRPSPRATTPGNRVEKALWPHGNNHLAGVFARFLCFGSRALIPWFFSPRLPPPPPVLISTLISNGIRKFCVSPRATKKLFWRRRPPKAEMPRTGRLTFPAGFKRGEIDALKRGGGEGMFVLILTGLPRRFLCRSMKS